MTVDRIRTALRTIALLHPITPPRPVEAQTRTAYGPRLPGSTDAIAVRAATTRDLGSIAWRLRTDLGHATVLDANDLTATASYVTVHADSLAILDSTAVHVLEGHARALADLVRQTRPSRIRVGDCPRCDTGVLYAALRPEDPDQLGNVIACDNHTQVDGHDAEGRAARVPQCGARWTSFEWRACWREVRQVHGPSGRRAGKPTRWDGWHPGAVERLAAALGIPRPSAGALTPRPARHGA